MAAINNINNNELRVLSSFNRYQQTSQTQAKIERIDREITIREKYASNSDKLINSYQELIASNSEIIQLHKEQRQLLVESRDLDKKRIGLMKEAITVVQKMMAMHEQGLVGQKPQELKVLSSQAEKLSNKENILKEKSINLDPKLDKLALKVEHAEKQVAKIESKVDTKASVLSTINETSFKKKSTPEYANTYKPSDIQLPMLKKSATPVIDLEHRPSNKKLDEELRQQVYQSQRNLYDSIVASRVKKLI